MLRSWIGMVFERSRQDRKLLLNRHMMASDNDGINPQKTLFPAKLSQLHTRNTFNIPAAEGMAQRALTTRCATPQKCLGTHTNS